MAAMISGPEAGGNPLRKRPHLAKTRTWRVASLAAADAGAVSPAGVAIAAGTADNREGALMSDQPPEAQQPEQMPAAAQPNHDGGLSAAPGPPPVPAPSPVPAAERVRLAARRRDETDYIFHYWSALGWTILTFGIYGLYVFYQLVRRMRDHNARRSSSWTRPPPWRGNRPGGRACSRRWPLPSSGPPAT